MRHAKSSWDDPALDDFDRPLNGRGRKAAPKAGAHIESQLIEQKFAIDLILCSTAIRAKETIELVLSQLKNSPSTIFRKDLYHASPERCVMVVAHNPGLEDFLAQLTEEANHFPTAGLAQVELELDSWSQFNQQTRGRLVEFWRPREKNVD